MKSTLEAVLSSGNVPELKSTQDMDKYADFIVTAISTAVHGAIPGFLLQGGPQNDFCPPKRHLPPKIFENTIKRTMETIVYCSKNQWSIVSPLLNPALRLDAKAAKTNADKAQLLAESVERHFGIQSDNLDSNHFDEVSQIIEGNYEYFYPPEDPDDYRSDMDYDHHVLMADIDSDTLIMIIKFIKRGKAPGGGGG